MEAVIDYKGAADRMLTLQHGDDRKTAALLTKQGLIGATGKPFTPKMITWIRHKHKIQRPQLKFADEYTVNQVEKLFNVSRHMVYYWIKNKQVSARKKPDNTFLIKITPAIEKSLRKKIKTSYKAGSMLHRRSASA